ncbi:MAG: glycosyl hydrolase family protein [Acidobacteriota bacterium]|nr:glycosyl hydrolase family protein [Acidobacteriota bacterium]
MAQPGTLEVSLSIDASTSLAKVPKDFMGLSYESGQLVYPDFFSVQNTGLIEIFKRLSPAGILRLGGNLSEFTVWSETDPTTPPEAGGLVGPDPGRREPRTFTITPLSIRNLQGFLKATGWRCIYGLNLGGGTPEQALAEASCVARTLGPQLLCVQFGNEPDLFRHRDQGNKLWSYEDFLAKWKTFRAAFNDRLPSVAVAGPDTAWNSEWVKRFVHDVPKQVMLATSHYYPEGPPSDPHMNIDLLLHPGARFNSSCRDALDSARVAGLPFRMAEGNSCYNAGKPGVSDTFASALWAGDFCLQLASIGCVGVNLHGGANGFYSPIVGSIGSGFVVRPEFYGLMLAQQFAGRTLHRTIVDTQNINLSAYAAAKDSGTDLVIVFNKDGRNVEVTLSSTAGGFKGATVERLEAPAIDSKSGLTFNGAEVGNDGQFQNRPGDPLSVHRSRLTVPVPAYSAALIRLL